MKNGNITITLGAARVNAGLTQNEAAKALKVTKNTLVSWEKYRTSPSALQARQLSELYDMPFDNIVFQRNKSN